jgi:hypothetical protein
MDLVTLLGTSDKVIQGKPETSYFIQRFAKSSQCSSQVIPLQLETAVNFGEEFTVDIYQEGDLVTWAYLEFTYPQGQPSAVCDSFGTYMLNWVQLEYGNQIIERIYGEFLEMTADITVPQTKQGALSNLTGKYLTSNLAVYDVRLYFDMFKKGLPVCSLKENARVRISLRNFYEGCPTATNVNPPFDATLFVNYVFLPELERNYFIKNELTYLFEQSQRFDTVLPASNCTVYTDFLNPTKELFFVIQYPTDLPYQWTDQLLSMRLSLNNTEVITYDMGTPLFMRGLQTLENHTRCPDRYFYMYSFSLDPENDKPTGSVNLSGVRQQIDFVLRPTPNFKLLHMYTSNYNVLKIKDGLLHVMFPVPFMSSGSYTNYREGVIYFNPSNPTSVSIFSPNSAFLSIINTSGNDLAWVYPTISGVTWFPSNNGITLSAATGAQFPSQSVTITATCGIYSYNFTFTLLIYNDPQFVLSNPGTQNKFTGTSPQTVVLTLTNPFNLTPIWSISPTIAGVSNVNTNTGMTLTIAQNAIISSQSVLVTAAFSTYSYPQTFTLSATTNPSFVLSNPGTQNKFTGTSPQNIVLTLTNPNNVTPIWSISPTIAEVSNVNTNTGMTLTVAQNAIISSQSVTVTAAFGIYSTPQTFTLSATTNPSFVLSNPGTTVLNTYYPTSSTARVVLTLTNPNNVTPIWSISPTIAGVSNVNTNTNITITAAQNTTFSAQSVTVTATYGIYSTPQTFTLSSVNTWQIAAVPAGGNSLYFMLTGVKATNTTTSTIAFDNRGTRALGGPSVAQYPSLIITASQGQVLSFILNMVQYGSSSNYIFRTIYLFNGSWTAIASDNGFSPAATSYEFTLGYTVPVTLPAGYKYSILVAEAYNGQPSAPPNLDTYQTEAEYVLQIV